MRCLLVSSKELLILRTLAQFSGHGLKGRLWMDRHGTWYVLRGEACLWVSWLKTEGSHLVQMGICLHGFRLEMPLDSRLPGGTGLPPPATRVALGWVGGGLAPTGLLGHGAGRRSMVDGRGQCGQGSELHAEGTVVSMTPGKGLPGSTFSVPSLPSFPQK